MSYKAIIFDLDGTLLDTLEDLADSVNRVLAASGFPAHGLEAYRYFVGDGSAMLITRALPEEKRAADVIRNCLRAFLEDYGRNWKVKTKPYPGIPEMLDALTARRCKMAVLSNKPHDFTRHCVDDLLGNWPFEVVFGQREDVPPKPDPAGALQIAKQLNLGPAEFLYLGDSAVDMKTAVAASMFPVGATWGFRTAEELLKNGCKVLIDRPLEVLDLML
ncbi:MAG: HAD family hydrolase [Desulfobacterales bacterium]|jgi:phosphoglycolate phosphatase